MTEVRRGLDRVITFVTEIKPELFNNYSNEHILGILDELCIGMCGESLYFNHIDYANCELDESGIDAFEDFIPDWMMMSREDAQYFNTTLCECTDNGDWRKMMNLIDDSMGKSQPFKIDFIARVIWELAESGLTLLDRKSYQYTDKLENELKNILYCIK